MKIMNTNLDFVLSDGQLLLMLVCQLVYLFVICWYYGNMGMCVWEFGNVCMGICMYVCLGIWECVYGNMGMWYVWEFGNVLWEYGNVRATVPIFLQQQNLFSAYIIFYYYQITCFDLRSGPISIEDTENTKSQEEGPCVCYTTTKISISVSITISVTIIFYLIFKCRAKFRK